MSLYILHVVLSPEEPKQKPVLLDRQYSLITEQQKGYLDNI